MKSVIIFISFISFIPSDHPAIEPSNHETIEPSSHNHSIKSSQHQNIPSNHHRIRSLNHHLDTLPPPPVLNQSIDTFYARQTHLQLLEFRESKKGEWLKFLPNLGITYTVTGQPRPSISLSSGILYQVKKAKQQRATKRQQIIKTQLLAAEKAKSQLTDLILQYEQLEMEYLTQQKLFAIEKNLFLIKKDEYERQEIAPSDFLRAKKTFLLQQQAIELKKHQMDRLISTIKLHCHFK
ncbi:MAG: hypothetical protein R2824_34755 [Saprospiraceae bacterium]|nr:hypothetical protein [Lewinella sp.]